MSTISKYVYKKVGQLFHWAYAMHYVVFFTGREVRHKRTEVMLPRLVGRGDLVERWHGRKKIYTVPRRKNDQNFEHGLGCTEGLVRFWRSDMTGMIIPERHLRGFGMVPEWGIRYNDRGTLLLFEYCTAKDFYRYGNVQSKITRYNNNLHLIEEKFDAKATVVFVCGAPRVDVDEFVWKRRPLGYQYYFTDYSTFLMTPIGDQLIDPIYILGEDCFPRPLRN